MQGIFGWLKEFRDGLESFSRGGDTHDPDIVAFAYASVFAVAMVLVALGASLFLWRDSPNILFAAPVFPRMGDCTALEAYLANPQIPPREGIDPSIVKLYIDTSGQLDGEAMIAECRYNLALHQQYLELEQAMNNIPVPIDEMGFVSQSALLPTNYGESLQSLLKILASGVALLGAYPLLVLAIRERGNEAFNHFSWENILLSFVMAFIVFYGVDVVWFFIERSLSQPLIYDYGTSVLFVALLIGVFAFLYFMWMIKLDITDLSLFTSLILLSGLIVSMLLTNHVWNAGVTNAYSTMSERAYPERLSYEVAGTLGSRGVFRVTFIGAGLLFLIYTVRLSRLVRRLKRLNPDKNAMLSPNIMLLLGLISAIFIAMVGIFPTDGMVMGNTEFLPASISGILHLIGAYGSPLVVMFMVLCFWFIGYPRNDGKDKFLPASSWAWFSIAATAIMMYLVGMLRNNVAHSLWMLLAYVLFLFLILYSANRWQSGKLNWLGLGWYSPLGHGLSIVIVGTLLDLLFPGRMTTVALEFVVLLIFSLFVYSYSKYLVEYREEEVAANGLRA